MLGTFGFTHVESAFKTCVVWALAMLLALFPHLVCADLKIETLALVVVLRTTTNAWVEGVRDEDGM
jgi:hypothetical protein